MQKENIDNYIKKIAEGKVVVSRPYKVAVSDYGNVFVASKSNDKPLSFEDVYKQILKYR